MRLVPYVPGGPVPPERLYALLAPAVFQPTPQRLAALLRERYARQDAQLYLLHHRDAPIGVVGVCMAGAGAAEILHIAVDARRRGQGAGRAIIDALFAMGKVEELRAETDAAAVGFYRRCGFRVQSLGERYAEIERFLCIAQRPSASP